MSSNVTPIDRRRAARTAKPDVPRRGGSGEDPRRKYGIDTRLPALPQMSGIAWRAIAAANNPPQYFNLGGRPVRIIGGTNGMPVSAQEMSLDMMSWLSARTAWWHKWTEKDGEIEQLPLERVMRDMLADPDPSLPPLKRKTRAPMFGPNGELSVQPGYDPVTQHYYDAGELRVKEPPVAPTDAHIAAAVAFLMGEFLGDFPFADQSSRAHTLSLMLNPFLRSLIEGPTPLYLIEAPSAGTGKGLLAHMAMLPALGAPPTLMPPSANEEETRKRLMAAVIGLPDAILMDNLADGLDSPSLSALLTAPGEWTDRVLGRTENRTVPFTATFMATGNNPSKSREMARRTITIRLDSKTERPENRRGFRHKRIERWAKENRSRLVGACLTIVQGWISRGMPVSDDVLGSYDAWAEIHGGVLEVCGVKGFLANRSDSDAITVSEDGQWAALCQRWWERFSDHAVTAGDLFPLAKAIHDFPLGKATDDRSRRTAFGMALSRNRDRIFDGRQIVYVGDLRRAAQYRLVSTGEVPF